jgi:hypothetical protein
MSTQEMIRWIPLEEYKIMQQSEEEWKKINYRIFMSTFWGMEIPKPLINKEL